MSSQKSNSVITHDPFDKKVEAGRLNMASKPAFYASHNPLGSIIETKLKDDLFNGKKFYLSCWSFENYSPSSISFTETLYPNNLKFDIKNQINLLPLNNDYKNLLFDFIDYANSKMSSGNVNRSLKQDYEITSFIGNQILNEQKCADSIIYQSAILKKKDGKVRPLNYINVAINPIIADKYMKIKDVFLIEVSDKSPNSVFNFDILEKGEITNEKIIFKSNNQKSLIDHNQDYYYQWLNLHFNYIY